MSDGFRVQQIDHVEVFVPSRWAAAKWYGEVLGLAIVSTHVPWADDPGGPLMLSSDGGQTMLALFRGEPQGDRPLTGHKRVAFRVDGAGFCRFLDRLESTAVYGAGGRLTRQDVADHGTAFSIYFNDPYGNRYEITTYDLDHVRKVLAC